MPDEKKWLCCGCGEPVDDDGFPTCKCPTDVLYKRGTNEHAIKPRPCATCGPRRETSFPKPSAMPADAIERAAVEIATRMVPGRFGDDGKRYMSLRQADDWTVAKRAALLAFASQQAPEGWRPIDTAPKDGTAILITRDTQWPEELHHVVAWADDRWELHDGKFDHALRGSEPTHWQPLPAPPAMLDAAPSVTQPPTKEPTP